MLSSILSGSTCAKCRNCCIFEEQSAWELPTFSEYDWDFDHDCFRYDATGNHITVTENDALKVWVYKGEVLPKPKKAAQPAAAVRALSA